MEQSFQEKVVIVTGAGQGIGKALALAYASQGARVVIADINQETGQQVADQIISEGGHSRFFETDVSQPSEIIDLVFKAFKKYNKIDVLVNNAGLSRWKSPLEISVDEWDYILNVNLRAYFLAAREAAKYMKKQGGGAIINIASTRAIMSEPYSEAYAASKGGILALTHALAISLGPDQIQVNAISPGWIMTGDYQSLRNIDHEQHPSGRVGKPDDIARACLFLSHPLNNFITGENLVIDGGMTRKMIYQE